MVRSRQHVVARMLSRDQHMFQRNHVARVRLSIKQSSAEGPSEICAGYYKIVFERDERATSFTIKKKKFESAVREGRARDTRLEFV